MRRPARLFACFLFAALTVHAQAPSPETRAAQAYRTAAQAGPLALRAFLAQFPKGADLHVHFSGAVYAETYIRDAGEDGLCVDPAALSFAKPPCTAPLLRGWIGYYGRYNRAELEPMLRHVNLTLVGWAMRKFKRLQGRKVGAAHFLEKLVQTQPGLFEHWRIDMIGAFA